MDVKTIIVVALCLFIVGGLVFLQFKKRKRK